MTKKSIEPPEPMITEVQRREHRPESGALYRAKRSSSGNYSIKTNDIVMVVSESPHLVDKTYTSVKNGQELMTTVREWTDLVILWSEKTIDMEGAREALWYHWFERVRYE